MRDYKKIKAYQNAEKLALEIYSVTKRFPKEELYGLVSQLRRAAVSVTANIAEGASRQHKKDYLNFLFMARGSVSEVECLLTLSNK
ncbi:MAG: four helix bundle protein [Candidatus Omnitrophica bacterium]|nr:four helix bundle protein [Candidatus Omnitrophota bacterium]